MQTLASVAVIIAVSSLLLTIISYAYVVVRMVEHNRATATLHTSVENQIGRFAQTLQVVGTLQEDMSRALTRITTLEGITGENGRQIERVQDDLDQIYKRLNAKIAANTRWSKKPEPEPEPEAQEQMQFPGVPMFPQPEAGAAPKPKRPFGTLPQSR